MSAPIVKPHAVIDLGNGWTSYHDTEAAALIEIERLTARSFRAYAYARVISTFEREPGPLKKTEVGKCFSPI